MKKKLFITLWPQWVMRVTGLAALALALTVMIGWHVHSTTLIQVRPTFAPMQYNTAFSFLLTGAALLAIALGRPRLAIPCSGLVTALALLTFSQYLFQVDFGIDRLLVEPFVIVQTSHPGRMSPVTAFCFSLAGVSLLFMSIPAHFKQRSLLLGLVSATIIALGLVSVVGYLTGITITYGWGQFTRVAAHTAAGFVALGLGILAFAWHEGQTEEGEGPDWLPLLVGLGVTLIALVLWQALLAEERAQLERTLSTTATHVKNETTTHLNAHIGALRRMAMRWEQGDPPTPEEWEFEAKLNIQAFSGYQAIFWADPTFRVRWFAPLSGNEALQGMDLAFEPQRQHALEVARNYRQTMITPPIELAQGGQGFSAYVPIFQGEVFAGVIGGVFHLGELFDTILSEDIAPGYAFTLLDGAQEIYSRYNSRELEAEWGQETEVILNNRVWRLRVWPEPWLLARQRSGLPEAILWSSLSLGWLLALTLRFSQTNLWRWREIERVNKKLKKEEQASKQLMSELQAIFQALPDVFLRLDAAGAILNYQSGAAFDLDAPTQILTGYNLQDIFPPDITWQLKQTISQVLQTGSVAAIEYSLPMLQGEQYFEARLSPLFDQQAIALVRNITERKRSEQWFSRLLESAPEAMIIVNGPGEIVLLNSQTEKLFGYTGQELIGQSIETLIPERFRGGYWSYRTRYMLKPYVRPMGAGHDLYGLSKEGSEFPVEINLSPLETEEGILIIASIRDISERKQAEARRAQRAAQLALINDIAAKIAAVLELDSLLDRTADLVQETFGYHHVALFLIDNDTARLKAIAGSYKTYLPADHSQKLSQGIIGWVATRGKRVIVNDVSGEPHYIPLIADRTEIQAELCLPIKVANQTVGVLDIQSPQLNAFGRNDIMAMKTLTNQLATAIENARLYQEVQQRNSENALLLAQTWAALTRMETLYEMGRALIASENLLDTLQAVVDGVATALVADRVTLMIFDPKKQEITHFVKSGPGQDQVVTVTFEELWQGLSGWTLRELKPALSPQGVPDPRESPAVQQQRAETNCGAIIVIPLRYQDKTPGTLTAINRPDERDFTEQDVELMMTMANQAAVAIENARLFEALYESERKYRSVIDSVKEVIFQTNVAGQWLLLNPAWTDITGFAVKESLGKVYLEYIHPDDRPQAAELHQSLLEREVAYCRYEIRFLTKKGDFRWLEVYAQLTVAADESIAGISGTLNDVTDRKRAVEALLTSETRFRTLTTHAPVGIFQTNVQGECVFVNTRWVEITGLSSDEAIGGGWAKTLHFDDRESVFAEWQAAAQFGREFAMEYRFQTSEGRVTWAFGNATPLRDEVGKITGYLGTVTDVSERKQTELLEKDRNQVLEMISQNKPLNVVLATVVQLVERQFPELLGSVLTLDDGRVYHRAAPNLPESFTHMVDGLELNTILKTPDMAAYQGETLIVNNIADKADKDGYRKLALKHKLLAYWSAPIFSSDGALLGFFIGYYRQPNKPAPKEQELVKMARRLAAIAIEHHQLSDQLAHQAQHDALTGLPNRTLFEDRLQQAIAHARRNQGMGGLLYLDLDRFKQVNDTLGHAAGDTLLRQVTARLQSCLREEDTLARMGGDEFTVVLPELESPQAAAAVAQRIIEIVTSPFVIREQELSVTTSVGISLYPVDGDEADELLRKADNALYRCKQQGKNSYQFFTAELDKAVHEHFVLRYRLQEALQAGEFQLYYQPQFKVSNANLVGLEALLRWNHPELGLVSPTKFIPIAEESGLIVPIGAWVLSEACRQNRAWQQTGYLPLRIAVNVSPLQFARSDFVEMVIQTLEQTALEPTWLQLELTESLVMQDPQEVAAKLDRLRAMGVIVAIDDFGTGYSSLSYLRQLPIDMLKIAEPFVREIGINLHETPSDEAIVMAIINLAHNLGLRVVAEGVETEQQLAFLRRVGCDEMQGFLLSKPLSAAEFEELLKQEGERLDYNVTAYSYSPELKPHQGGLGKLDSDGSVLKPP